MARFLTAMAAATVAVAQIPEQYVIRRRTKMRRKSQFPLLRCERGAQLTRTALSRLPHRLRRLHISLTGVAGQMALDFVAFADGQSVQLRAVGVALELRGRRAKSTAGDEAKWAGGRARALSRRRRERASMLVADQYIRESWARHVVERWCGERGGGADSLRRRRARAAPVLPRPHKSTKTANDWRACTLVTCSTSSTWSVCVAGRADKTEPRLGARHGRRGRPANTALGKVCSAARSLRGGAAASRRRAPRAHRRPAVRLHGARVSAWAAGAAGLGG